MYPVVSKPAHAIGTANCSANGNMIDHQSQCGNDGINENESNHFLDPNLADIISNVILNPIQYGLFLKTWIPPSNS